MIEVNCTGCGIKIPVYPYEIKDGHGNFHSKECYHKWKGENTRGDKHPNWKGGKVEVICQYCKKPFKAYLSQIKIGKGKFCSNECFGKHYAGENSPVWKTVEVICKNCGKPFNTTREE